MAVDKRRLRGPQFRAVEALEKLGSSLEHAQQGDGYVLLSKPFHADRTPSVEIFRDGGYRDWAEDTTGWAEIGLKSIGTYLDLEEAAEGRFAKIWNELSPLSSEGREYLEGRKISTEGLKSDGPAVCFPLWHGDKMVGIQRRFTDGRTPKNRCFAGSDASGLFYPPGLYAKKVDNYFFICEGATDSYTLAPYGLVAGILSASTLSGLKELIPSTPERIVLCFDADPAGREAERKVLEMFPDIAFYRLGLLGCKDVNEMFNEGNITNMPINPIERDPTPDLEFIEGSLASAPADALWLGWWPPEVPKGAPTSFTPKDGYSWYVFPHDIDPLKAREWCWSRKVSGYVVKEVSA